MRAIAKALGSALMFSLLLTGCGNLAYFARDTRTPMLALRQRADIDVQNECLILFMPGMLDTPDTFVERGFFEDTLEASPRCDLIAADAHFGYYRNGTVRERIRRDILGVAARRGYSEIWVVGVSMGGLGALMVAQENPDLIRGIVLLAPYLGDPEVVASIRNAGGLSEWQAPEHADPYDEDEFDAALWTWLQGYAQEDTERPELYVGVGLEDDLRVGVHLLRDVLPGHRSGTAAGGHGWATWRVLFRRILESPPWDPHRNESGVAVEPHIGG